MIENTFHSRSNIILFATALLITLTFYSPVWATTYYVDATSGNNSNAGTSATTAWLTIQRAVDAASAGDTVYVKEGTYNERIVCKRSGSAGNKIIIKSSPPRTATVNGGFEISGNYIRIEGFNITIDYMENAIEIKGSYAEVVDNYFFNCRYKAIRGNTSTMPLSVLIADNHIFHSQSGIIVEGNDWLIENNEIEKLWDYGNSDCDYTRFFGRNHIFRGNYFHGTNQNEIGGAHVDGFQTWITPVETNNITIENNRIFHFHQALLQEKESSDRGILFKNNIVGHNFDTSLGGYGLYNHWDEVTVIHNVFVDINLMAVNMLYDSDDNIVKNNIFYDSQGSYRFAGMNNIGDYNLMYKTSNNPDIGSHDLVGVDPMFVDPNNDDYRLRPGSPACTGGEGGTYIGAIPCGGSETDTEAPSSPPPPQTQTISSSQINLTWNPSSDNTSVTGYKIYRDGVQTGNSASNSYQDVGLSPSTNYTYTVSAYDASGNESNQSDPQVEGTLPSTPERLRVEFQQ